MELPLIPKCYGSGEDFGRNYPIMNQLPFLVRVCSIVLVITQLEMIRSATGGVVGQRYAMVKYQSTVWDWPNP